MANKFQATAMIFFLLSALLGRLMAFTKDAWNLPSVICTLLIGLLMTSCFCLGIIYLFVSSQLISENQDILSALFHFIVTYNSVRVGKKSLKTFRKTLLDPRKAQEVRLREIIITNKDTHYGVTHNLKNIHSLHDLKVVHPLTKYDYYEPFVQRVAKGETNVMTTKPVDRLVLTSGTTGKGKLIPRCMGDKTEVGLNTQNAFQLEFFSRVQPMQKILILHCNTRSMKSEGGITVGPLSKMEREKAKLMLMFSTPSDGLMIETTKEAFYIHFLFALRERHLGSAFCIFSSLFVDGFKFFEKNWPLMVYDIAHGTVNKDLHLPSYIRESLERAISPGDVKRAEEVRRECEKGQQGIMKRLWPFMEYVTVADNVGIRYALMETIGKGIKICSPGYFASEGVIGLNFNLENKGDEEYVLNVKDNIYEFILENDIDKTSPETYLIDEVVVGENYELVLTQIYGLYRYRFGDVVQITGFYEKTPKVKFMYRAATLLNICSEKVDQPTVIGALKTALDEFPGVEMNNYCVAESTMLAELQEESEGRYNGAHYVFFLEMNSTKEGRPSMDVDTDQMARLIDDAIYNNHTFYRRYRDTKQIHACKVYTVKAGTFQELKKFILTNTSASEAQFKMPQKLRTTEMVKLMLKNRSK